MPSFNQSALAEAWIGFTFEPNPQRPGWSRAVVNQFLERYRDELPQQEHMRVWFDDGKKRTPRGKHGMQSSTGLLHGIDSGVIHVARAGNRGGSCWLQLADNQMGYSRVRHGDTPPDFEPLLDGALAKLADYVADFKPANLLRAELHDVYLIEIPAPEGQLALQDYFRLGVDLPEDAFGPARDFLIHMSLSPPAGGGQLAVAFRSEPPAAEREPPCGSEWSGI